MQEKRSVRLVLYMKLVFHRLSIPEYPNQWKPAHWQIMINDVFNSWRRCCAMKTENQLYRRLMINLYLRNLNHLNEIYKEKFKLLVAGDIDIIPGKNIVPIEYMRTPTRFIMTDKFRDYLLTPNEERSAAMIQDCSLILKIFNIYDRLPKAIKILLMREAELLYVPRFRTILRHNHQCYNIYFLLRGKIAVYFASESHYPIATIGPRTLFGLSINHNLPRVCTYRSYTYCEIISIPHYRVPVLKKLFWEFSTKNCEIYLKQNFFFHNWEEEHIKRLVNSASLCFYKSNELIETGMAEPSGNIYFVLDGEVKYLTTLQLPRKTLRQLSKFAGTKWRDALINKARHSHITMEEKPSFGNLSVKDMDESPPQQVISDRLLKELDVGSTNLVSKSLLNLPRKSMRSFPQSETTSLDSPSEGSNRQSLASHDDTRRNLVKQILPMLGKHPRRSMSRKPESNFRSSRYSTSVSSSAFQGSLRSSLRTTSLMQRGSISKPNHMNNVSKNISSVLLRQIGRQGMEINKNFNALARSYISSHHMTVSGKGSGKGSSKRSALQKRSRKKYDTLVLKKPVTQTVEMNNVSAFSTYINQTKPNIKFDKTSNSPLPPTHISKRRAREKSVITLRSKKRQFNILLDQDSPAESDTRVEAGRTPAWNEFFSLLVQYSGSSEEGEEPKVMEPVPPAQVPEETVTERYEHVKNANQIRMDVRESYQLEDGIDSTKTNAHDWVKLDLEIFDYIHQKTKKANKNFETSHEMDFLQPRTKNEIFLRFATYQASSYFGFTQEDRDSFYVSNRETIVLKLSKTVINEIVGVNSSLNPLKLMQRLFSQELKIATYQDRLTILMEVVDWEYYKKSLVADIIRRRRGYEAARKYEKRCYLLPREKCFFVRPWNGDTYSLGNRVSHIELKETDS
ncbi:hypothetical protein SNEBB_006005 [Seison nebaliae]|nr:hypothetical protein SNEBB_006005 [Seison nebaliae]